jgi:hypothetical protein
MMATLVSDTERQEAIAAARRILAKHVRRTYPDTGCCAFCGGTWLPAGPEGRRVNGCAARQLAASFIAEVGGTDLPMDAAATSSAALPGARREVVPPADEASCLPAPQGT